MVYAYSVSGMMCNGCKASVEQSIAQLEHVESVSVNLESQEVKIAMSSHVNLGVLQNALPAKYSISEKKERNVFQSSGENDTTDSDIKALFPLFLIFTYLTVTSILLNSEPWNGRQFMLDFMGLFYIVFSFFKFLDLKGFPESFKMYDPLAKQFPIYGWIYPFIELTLGIMFLMRLQIDVALKVTVVVLGITTIGVTRTILDKKAIQCACLGTALKLPMTKATLIENAVMLVMALLMLLM